MYMYIYWFSIYIDWSIHIDISLHYWLGISIDWYIVYTIHKHILAWYVQSQMPNISRCVGSSKPLLGHSYQYCQRFRHGAGQRKFWRKIAELDDPCRYCPRAGQQKFCRAPAAISIKIKICQCMKQREQN